jgi:DNA (cytosine-5)-methyltransferase 1
MESWLIPQGDVDDRPIQEVQKKDLKGYTQAHFFAGIGGWPLAFLLLGVKDDFPHWTGSCPCQSFSAANLTGKGKKDKDKHLWPWFYDLIAECRPPLVFGEQVPGAIRHGWLDDVARDLGKAGYSFGAAVLPALYVGAQHRRERIYFVGDLGYSDGESPVPKVGESFGSEHGFDFNKGFWEDAVAVQGADGKSRGREPGTRLLADGLPGRLAALHGLGNAIVPQQAAEFVAAFFEAKRKMSRQSKPKAKAASAGR